MDTILSKIEDHSIMICPSSKKKSITKEMSKVSPLLHLKLIDKKELIDCTYFTYDINALVYLSDNFGYKYELGQEILDNITGIKLENLKGNSKLEKMGKIYKLLKENNLLEYHPYFSYLFQNKKVYVYKYSRLDKEINQALINLGITPIYLDNVYNKEYQHYVTKYNTLEDEVIDLFVKIGELIKKGVSLNHIYLYSYPSEYQWLIEKYAHFYHFIIESNTNDYLYDSPIYKTYLSLLSEYDFEEAYQILKEKSKHDKYDATNKLVDILTSVLTINKTKQEKITLLNFLAKRKPLRKTTYEQEIRICDSSSIITDEDYVFVIGFSLGDYPKIYKDTDFYLDQEKEMLGLNTSKNCTKIDEEALINFMKYTKNLSISYKERHMKNVYYPSLLINMLQMPIKGSEKKFTRYSSKASKMEAVKAKDLLYNYNIDTDISESYSNEELEYRVFDHHFNGLCNYYNNDFLKLSYTSINQYNKCPFFYFISRVLKIGEFEETFSIKLGNLYHHILEDSVDKDILLTDYQEEFDKLFTTPKERFFASTLLPQVLDVIRINRAFQEETKYNRVEAEKELSVKIDDNTTLYGKIDKVMMDEEKKCLAIVDYKTNEFTFKKEKTKCGIDMQLPVYAYLLKENYQDFQNTGMYIQNVCLDKNELKKDNKYKLAGLTVRSLETVKRFEPSIGNRYDENGKLIKKSQYIGQCSLIGDGKELSKVGFVEKELIAELENIAKEQIIHANENIRKGEFPISPVKFIGERNYACSYCKFNDICFVKSEDIHLINLKEKSDDEV